MASLDKYGVTGILKGEREMAGQVGRAPASYHPVGSVAFGTNGDGRALKHVVMTGATGFLGARFVRALATTPIGKLSLLIRPRDGQDAGQRLRALGLDLPGVEAIAADIADRGIVEQLCGLGPVDEFWHIAGLTEFHETKRPQLEQVNIEGTRHALDLAGQWKVTRFFHVSTAYVAGICDGPVLEDGLVANPVFRNPYEETKYRGEQLVRASQVPWVIVRPSILLGDSVTGDVDSDKMLYGICKVYHLLARWVHREEREEVWCRDRCYRLRARDTAAKNCICVDDAVRLLLRLHGHAEVGRTYHCCHSCPTTAQDLHEAGAIATNAPFIYLSDDGAPSGDRKQRFLDRSCRIYEPYMLLSDPVFDLTNTLRVDPEFRPATLNASRLKFLFDVYVAALGHRQRMPHDTTLDLSRHDAVRHYGSFPLAYNSMSRQFLAFTAVGMSGYLPYAAVDKTAIMVGDPLSGRPTDLLRAFVSYCDRENRGFCALQVRYETALALRTIGCCINKLGIETSIDLKRLDLGLHGKEYRTLRKSLNIAKRYGVTVHERTLAQLCGENISAIFADWLAHKKNRHELHLLLRPPSLETEPGVRYFTAEYQKRWIAVVFFMPIYRDGQIVGYFADVERYRTTLVGLPARLNLMKLIQFEAAKAFRREGIDSIALGMSPLYQVAESEFNDNPELTALLEQLYEENSLYAFQGIAIHTREYPCRLERPVYIATRTRTGAEEVLDLLKGVGFLG